jgi:thiol peroxidase
MINDGIFDDLLSRCVIITNEKNKVIYTEQVEEIGQEPNYEKALEVLKN